MGAGGYSCRHLGDLMAKTKTKKKQPPAHMQGIEEWLRTRRRAERVAYSLLSELGAVKSVRKEAVAAIEAEHRAAPSGEAAHEAAMATVPVEKRAEAEAYWQEAANATPEQWEEMLGESLECFYWQTVPARFRQQGGGVAIQLYRHHVAAAARAAARKEEDG